MTDFAFNSQAAHKRFLALSNLLDANRVRRWIGLPVLLALAAALTTTANAADSMTVETLLKTAAPNATAEKYPEVQQAIDKFDAHDGKAALELLEEAKKKHPELAPAELMFAELLVAANQSRFVQNALEECVKKHPDDPEAYLMLGDISFADQRVAEAELLFERAGQLAANLKDSPHRMNECRGRSEAGLAAVAEKREQWDLAKKHLDNWLKIVQQTGASGSTVNEMAANAHVRLGNVAFHADTDPKKVKGAKEASKEFQLAAAADSKVVIPDIALAVLYEDAGMPDDAKKLVEQATAHLPDDPVEKINTLVAAARWAVDNDRPDDILKFANQAFDIDPKSKRAAEAKYFIGIAQRLKGDANAAEHTFEDVLAMAPDNFQASNQLAQVLAEQRSDSDKQQMGLKIAAENQTAAQSNPDAKRDPTRVLESASTLGWVLFLNGRYSQADQVFEAIAKTGVAGPDLLYYRGCMFEHDGQTDKAVAAFEAALAYKRGFFIHRQEAKDRLAKLK